MIDDYLPHAIPPPGKPNAAFNGDPVTVLNDPARTVPDILQVLQGALAKVH